jgi:hypothetical protein
MERLSFIQETEMEENERIKEDVANRPQATKPLYIR